MSDAADWQGSGQRKAMRHSASAREAKDVNVVSGEHSTSQREAAGSSRQVSTGSQREIAPPTHLEERLIKDAVTRSWGRRDLRLVRLVHLLSNGSLP